MASLPPVVWSDDVLRHEPRTEVWVGVRDPRHRGAGPGPGAPRGGHRGRGTGRAVLDVRRRGAPPRARPGAARPPRAPWPTTGPRGSTSRWSGRTGWCPYVFPTPGMLDGLPFTSPAATHARAGVWCYDTMTLVGPGTWTAARAAVDVTLTAVDLVVGGSPSAYALVRPPGHHATRRAFGGSCYLNNAAVAAEALARARRGAGRRRRHRRAPRQRHPGGVLGAGRRVLRLAARRPGGGLVPALRRARGRAGRGRR